MNKLATYKLHSWIVEDVLSDYEYAKYSLIFTKNDELEEEEMRVLVEENLEVLWFQWVGKVEKYFGDGHRPHFANIDHNFTELNRSLFESEEEYNKERTKDRGIDFVRLLDAEASMIPYLHLTKQITNEEKVFEYANQNPLQIGHNVMLKNKHDKSRVSDKLSARMSYDLKKAAYRLMVEMTPESKKTLGLLLRDVNQAEEAILNYTAHFKDIQLFAEPTEGLMQIRHLMMFCARAYYDTQAKQAILVYDNLREELEALLKPQPTKDFTPIGLHKNKVMENAFNMYWQNKEWQKEVEKESLNYLTEFFRDGRKYKFSPKIGSFDCTSFVNKAIALDKSIDFEKRYLKMYVVRLFLIGLFHLREKFFQLEKDCLIDAMQFIKQKPEVSIESIKQDLRLLGLSGTPESDIRVIHVHEGKIPPCEEQWKEIIYNEFYETFEPDEDLAMKPNAN